MILSSARPRHWFSLLCGVCLGVTSAHCTISPSSPSPRVVVAKKAGARKQPTSPAPRPKLPPQGDYWALTKVIELKGRKISSFIQLKQEICYASRHTIRLDCVHLRSGRTRSVVDTQSASSRRRWYSKALFVHRGIIYQAYQLDQHVLIRQIEPQTGKVLYRQEIPFTQNPRDTLLALAVYKQHALVAYRSRYTKPVRYRGRLIRQRRYHGWVVQLDLAQRTAGPKTPVSGITFRGAHRGQYAVYWGQRSGKRRLKTLSGFDIATGKKLWQFALPQGHWLRPVRISGEGVYLVDSKNVAYHLDLKTGRVLKRRRVGKKRSSVSYVAPTLHGQHIYVPTRPVQRLSLDLRAGARAPLSAWIRGTMTMVNKRHLAMHSARTLYVLDAKTLKPIRRISSNAGSWVYSGPVLNVDGAMVTFSRYTYNYASRLKLLVFRQVSSGHLRFDRLSARTHAFLDGRHLGGRRARSVELAVGIHHIDLLKPGFYAARVRVRIDHNKTVALTEPVSWHKLPLAAARPWPRNLPSGFSLRLLNQKMPRLVPVTRYKKSMMHRGRLISLHYRSGFGVQELATGKTLWSHSRKHLVRLMNPALLNEKKALSFSKKPLLATVAQDEGLIIVVTQGFWANWLAAFDIRTGGLRWRVPIPIRLPQMSSHRGSFFSGAFWANRGLLWHRAHHTLYARSLRTGRLVLVRHDPKHGTHRGDLVFDGDTLYYHQNRYVTALSIIDNRVKWRLDLNDAVELVGTPNKRLILALSKKRIYAISRGGKVVAKSIRLRGTINDNQPVLDAQNIYVCGHYANLQYALRQSDLKLLWKYRGPVNRYSSPCQQLLDDHHLLVLGGNGIRMLFDKSNGRLVNARSYRDPRALPVSPHLWATGRQLCFAEWRQSKCYLK